MEREGEYMKTILKKTGILILTVILICSIWPLRADAAFEIPGNCQVQTDTGAAGIVKTLDYSYDGNTGYGHASERYGEILFSGDYGQFRCPAPGRCLYPCGGGESPLGKCRKSGYFPAAK